MRNSTCYLFISKGSESFVVLCVDISTTETFGERIGYNLVAPK